MAIQLSDHFTYGRLLRFVLPSIATMLFISAYNVVDGLFVSNFVGKTAFASVNLIFPMLMIVGSFGFMMGRGGTAVVAKTMGEGHMELANRYFSLIVYVTAAVGLLCTLFGYLLMPYAALFLGAQEQMLSDCTLYGRICTLSLPFFMLQNVFQSFFVAAERPHLNFWVMLLAGCLNMLLDAIFILGFHWGLTGAAWATVLSEFTGGIVPLIYFICPNSSKLHLGKTQLYWPILGRTLVNGSSEMIGSISASFLITLYNYQLIKLSGENGVAAYGVIGYVCFIFAAIFIGYSEGCSPIISYHFGAGNNLELRNLFKKSTILTVSTGFIMMIVASFLAVYIARSFVGYDPVLFNITVYGLHVYAIAFSMFGFNIFSSALFTALNNGLISGIISFLRTMVFQIASIFILPMWWGLNGIWYSVVVAEAASLAIALIFLLANRSKYQYF